MQPAVYFAGTPDTVAHHAAPFADGFRLQIAAAEQIVQVAQPGDLAIFYTEHFDACRDACMRLKANQVATLYMIDGILEWRNAWENDPQEVACPFTMRPVLSHKVACIGPAQGRQLAAWGNVDKVEVVGIPRLDSVPIGAVWQPNSRGENSTEKNGRPFRVLVVTAKTPAFTDQQWQTVRRSLHDLKQRTADIQLAAGRPLQLRWRLTRGLADELGVDNQLDNFHGTDLLQVLNEVDAVIATPSTVMIEAMRLGLPVAQLDYHNRPHYVQTGWDIAAAEHIEPTLQGMAVGDPVRLHFQAQQLAEALLLESSATQRMESLIQKMLDTASQQIQAGQSLRFPPNLLTVPNGCLFQLNNAEVFCNEEFAEPDHVELQAQLAHCRREIDHLQREKQQLQSELDQAHEIFDSINNHPIAGPVVRVGQRTIDLLNKMRSVNKPDQSTPQ